MEMLENQLQRELKCRCGQYIKMAQAISKGVDSLVYVFSLKYKMFLYFSKYQLLENVVDTAEVYRRGLDYLVTLVEDGERNALEDAFSRMREDYRHVPEKYRADYLIFLNQFLVKGKKKYMLFNRLSVLSHSEDGLPDLLLGTAKVGKDSYTATIMAGVPGTEYFKNYSSQVESFENWGFVELTDSERTMLGFAECGYSVSEIAAMMSRTEDTVKFYRRQIFKKLEVRTIAEAVAYAAKNYVALGERHLYIKLNRCASECKEEDGCHLFSPESMPEGLDPFTKSVLYLIRGLEDNSWDEW